MNKMWFLLLSSLSVSLIGTACGTASTPVVSTLVPSASPQPTAVKSLPTSVAQGQMIVYNDLQVAMSQAEITDGYVTEYGSTREPPAGKKFLWIHVTLKNSGQLGQDLPAPEHFSALSATAEFKPTYGHRKDYMDYTALQSTLDPGQELDAWLRFDIPADAELKDLLFAFMPESSQVSVGCSSNDYPWGDHPIFLWMCGP